jgi:L-rhamnonate dehydratase
MPPRRSTHETRSASTRRWFLTRAATSAGVAAAASSWASRLPAQNQPDATQRPLKITSVDAYPVRLWDITRQGAKPDFQSDFDPARWRYRGPFAQLVSAIVVVIRTDQGITGFGLGAGGSVAREIIHGHLRHLLLGVNPLNVELLWDQMYTSSNAYGRRGVFVMALSGIDNALWDILGKHAGQPVYRLLGGTTQEKIPGYFTSGKPEAGLELGFRHFKMGIRDGVFEGEEGMQRIVRRLREARRTIGPDNSLMIDCGSRWHDVEYTIEMARRLEDVGLYWIEEPLSPDNVPGYARLVREVKSTKIASGEHEYTRFGFSNLIRHKAVEILQPDVSWCGGVTSLRRIAAMAAEHDLEFIPHRGGSLYGLPLALSSLQCPWAESFGTGDRGTDLMAAMTSPFKNGYYYPSEKPGFGTEVTEELVKKHARS